jgi:hypothetical protein
MLPAEPDAAETSATIPVGRLATAKEVAELALAMLSNGYLANKVFTFDGGIYPA